MVMAFDSIEGFGLDLPNNGTFFLTVEFSQQPVFAEFDHQSGGWHACKYDAHSIPVLPHTILFGTHNRDFTKKQASRCKRHVVKFPPQSLHQPLETMLALDARLQKLAFVHLPQLDDPFFRDGAATRGGNRPKGSGSTDGA